jgi:PTH1 family peptidyl-tRNA hydrolase
MSLFQNRPQVSDPVNYYTVGLNKTILLVGLGNPGEEYNLTRHNIGFDCLDAFVSKQADMSNWIIKQNLKCVFSEGRIGDTKVYAIKPTTFMNSSGEAVQAVSSFYKIGLEHIVVVHDELDVDYGLIRMRTGGTSAGHNGIKSITNYIGENYGRIRVGIGPKKPARIDSADFVLQKFSNTEQAHISSLTQECSAILSEYAFSSMLPQDTRSFIF